MIIGVSGCRADKALPWTRELVRRVLVAWYRTDRRLACHVGDCPLGGVDDWTVELCSEYSIPCRIHRYDRSKSSPKCFHDRNQAIVDAVANMCGVAELSLIPRVFLIFPGNDSHGTYDTARRAHRAGLTVYSYMHEHGKPEVWEP